MHFAALQNLVLLLTSVVAYVIPDVPHLLQKQLRREKYLTGHVIESAELDRSKGHAGPVNLGNLVSLRSQADDADDFEQCTLMAGTDRA